MVREAEVVQSFKLYQYAVEATKLILKAVDWSELNNLEVPMELGAYLKIRFKSARTVLG